MSQKNVLMIVIIVLVVVAGVLLAWYFMQEEDATNTNTVTNTVTNTTGLNMEKEIPVKGVIWIVDGSFNPSVITIEAGDTVTWINKDEIDRQVASDPYPSHTDLPELVSDVLTNGDEYEFTFDKTGAWVYHDNLNPISKGTVIVE